MKNLALLLFIFLTHHIALSNTHVECYGVFNEPVEGIEKNLSCNFQSTDWDNKYRLPETFIPDQNTPIKYINI